MKEKMMSNVNEELKEFDAYDVYHEWNYIGRVNVRPKEKRQFIYLRAKQLYPLRVNKLREEDLEYRYMGHHSMRDPFTDVEEYRKIIAQKEAAIELRKRVPVGNCKSLNELAQNRYLDKREVQAAHELAKAVEVKEVGFDIKRLRLTPLICISRDYTVTKYAAIADYIRENHCDHRRIYRTCTSNILRFLQDLNKARFTATKQGIVMPGTNDFWEYCYYLIMTQGYEKMSSMMKKFSGIILLNKDLSEYYLCKSTNDAAMLLDTTVQSVRSTVSLNRKRISEDKPLTSLKDFYIIDDYTGWKEDLPQFRKLLKLKTTGKIVRLKKTSNLKTQEL